MVRCSPGNFTPSCFLFHLLFLPYNDSFSLFNHSPQIRSNMYLPPMKDCLQEKMYATSEICTDSNVLRISALYGNFSLLRCLIQQTHFLGIQLTHSKPHGEPESTCSAKDFVVVLVLEKKHVKSFNPCHDVMKSCLQPRLLL